MNKIFLLSVIFTVASAQAETELACWNIFAARGSRPVLKAQIGANNGLSNIQIDYRDRLFEGYAYTEDLELSANRGHQHTESSLSQPGEIQGPEEITTGRSPYRGNNEYGFAFGHYKSEWPASSEYDAVRSDKDYRARLILPKDLSRDALANFRIRNATERSNAVMIFPAAFRSSQAGDNYLRMFCTSR